MTTGRHSQVFQQLRQAVLARDGAGLTDAELMSHFVVRRDSAALEALIRRHGSMVWSVCRRVLSNEQDVEDAFQASFLVFVRKAASIRGRAQVGNWLYGVAYRTALKARSATALRRNKERRAAAMNSTQAPTEEGWTELLPLLDQELARLPDKYRTALVLCELEGRSRKEAARQLGIPEGTLSSRLATGRRMLAKRLGRPGLALSAGALTTAAAVPPALMASTVKTLSSVAAGTAVAGAISVRVGALAEGVVRAMFLSKLSIGAALLAVVGVLAAGAGGATYYATAADPQPQPQAAPVASAQVKERNVDKEEANKREPPWGKAVDGIQVRLRMSKTAGGSGEFAVDVRNHGEKDVQQRRSLDFCIIMLDGQWYLFQGAADVESQMFQLRPGQQIDDWAKASLDAPWVHGFAQVKDDSTPYTVATNHGFATKPLQLEPGKHALRVGVAFDGGPGPVSQPVEIEIGKESAWGEAVDGIQARIRTSRVVWEANVAPTFHLDLRNQGKMKPNARRVPYDCQIEVDKVWYSFDEPSGPYVSVGELLKPGAEVNDWTTVSPDKNWGSFPGKAQHFPLPPGKHTIRIAYQLQGTTPALRPISGPIEIEISDKAADGAKAPPTGGAAPAAGGNKETPARRAVDIRKKLGEPIQFELAIDLSLDKALDQLLVRIGIPWKMNASAFAKQGGGPDIVAKTTVARIRLVEGLSRQAILERLLSSIASKSDDGKAVCVIRPDCVEITTRRAYLDEFYPGRKDFNLPPLVYAAFDKVPLSKALAELGHTTGANVILPGYLGKDAETKVTAELNGVPLDAAVTVLADMADLKYVRLGNVYYVTTPERARVLEAEEKERRLQEEKAKEEPAKPPANKPDAKK